MAVNRLFSAGASLGALARTHVPRVSPRDVSRGAWSRHLHTARTLGTDALKLTHSCSTKLNAINAASPTEPPRMLRVEVESGGCSGFSYKFELTRDVEDDDLRFERDGAVVIIDPVSLEMIEGSEIDFRMELISRSFAVTNNPKAEAGCGCGVSFTPKFT